MDTYQSTIDYLYNQLPMFQNLGAGAYKPGLETAKALDNAFGNKHRQYRKVHIAGTNGKGSTSHAIASVLMAQGYKVGLYTSPHLVDFRERIRVNGEMIAKEAVIDFVKRYREMNLGLSPSFFELTTIMAFDYFAAQDVDYAVIETGLGGRLDTTNIIMPEVAIITNISLDHTALLGDTIEQVACEKAGIIKPNVPVVIGEADSKVRKVMLQKAKAEGSEIVFAEDSPYCDVKSDLEGDFQEKNLNTVMHALKYLPVSETAIREGLANVQERTGLRGRWMEISKDPLIICDTGHNPGAWQYIAPRLAKMANDATLRVVLGFANDKDVDSIFTLLPKNAEYYFVTPEVKRGRNSEELLNLAISLGLNGRAYGSVKEGFSAAKDASHSNDVIFIGGSNYVVAEIL